MWSGRNKSAIGGRKVRRAICVCGKRGDVGTIWVLRSAHSGVGLYVSVGLRVDDKATRLVGRKAPSGFTGKVFGNDYSNDDPVGIVNGKIAVPFVLDLDPIVHNQV